MIKSSSVEVHRIACVVLFGLAVQVSSARAACLQGELTTYWEVGGFCDSADRDCTGWNYTNLSQNTRQGIREVKLELYASDGVTLLAVGNTNSAGQYSMCYSGSPSTVKLIMEYTHISDAFSIRNSSGGTLSSNCTLSGLGSGTNTGNCTWGSNNAPHAPTSVYEQAFIALKNIVNNMGGVKLGFTNAQIRMDQSASRTWGYDKIVKLADFNEFDWTVAHEIGHVAAHMASRSRYLGTDDGNKDAGLEYDACGGDGSASWTSTDECKDVVWNEAIAELFGAWAVQGANASSPCTGSGTLRETECVDDGGWSLEAVPSCASRMRIQDAVRYYWDTFDTGGSDGFNVVKDDYDEILNRYPGGRDNHTKDENWCCTFWGCWPCNHNGKNVSDWEYHQENETGIDTSGLLSTNCSS